MIKRSRIFFAAIAMPLVLCKVFIPPEHRPEIIKDLRKIMNQYSNHLIGTPPSLDDLYCKCNENGCDTEIIDVAGTNYTGICRVPKGGKCRTLEAFNTDGLLSEVHFECVSTDRLIPSNKPLLCVLREDHPRLRQVCCDNASLCNDAIIPPLNPYTKPKIHDWVLMTTILIVIVFLAAFIAFVLLFGCVMWACNNKAKLTMRKYLSQLPFLNIQQSPLRAYKTTSNTKSPPEDGNPAEQGLLVEVESSGRNGSSVLTKRTMAHQVNISNTIIARGRYGEVRLGEWKGEQVAVKIFNSRDEQSFFRESKIYMSNALKHPSVLRYISSDNKGFLDAGIQTQLLIVTEYVPNGSLFDYLSEHTVDKTTGLKMIQSISSGLAFLHTEIPGIQSDRKPSVAHRDIKSKNILVKKDLTCVIADLGMAIFNIPEEDFGNKKFGTIRYMAPELLTEEEDVTFTTYVYADVYACALVFWEIVRRINYKPDGGSHSYQLPYFEYCDRDPLFNEMKDIVVTRGLRPNVDLQWESDDALKVLSRIMTECWSEHPLCRLTSLNIRIQLDRLVKADEARLDRKLLEPSVTLDRNSSHYHAGNVGDSGVPLIQINDSHQPGSSQVSDHDSDILPLEPANNSPLKCSQHDPDSQNVIITTPESQASQISLKNQRPLSPLSEKDEKNLQMLFQIF